jgi:HEAT repeat protein
MRRVLIGLAVFMVGVAHADEATDKLAKELVGVVRDPRQGVRERTEAARTLGKLGPRAAAVVPDLIAQLKRLRGDEMEPLQEAVIDALGEIGSAAKPALPTLAVNVNRTIDLDLAVRRATDQILLSDDARDLKALLQQLRSREVGLRLRAAKSLGALKVDADAAGPALTEAMADPDGDVRRAAVAAYRLIRPEVQPPKEMVQALVADLKDPDDGVRLLAVRTLGRLGRRAAEATPAVEPLLADPDRDVRKAAADTLVRLSLP